MSEIVAFTGLLDVATGELLPATIQNAGRVLLAARMMEENIRDIKRETTAFLAAESARAGTKTLRDDGCTVTLTGGTTVEYDAQDLMEALRMAGCPEDRIDAAVKTEITYKVDRAVLRQLAAANPEYRAAIELAAREVEKPYRATVALKKGDA